MTRGWLIRLVWFVLGCGVVGAVWAWTEGGRPALAPLSALVRRVMIPVEVVREIPGEPTVVEVIRVRTVPTEVDAAALRELARQLCPGGFDDSPPVRDEPGAEPTPATLHARVWFDAAKHVGLEGDRVVAGWTGSAACETAPSPAGPWALLARQPFDLEASRALSELAPREMVPRTLPRLFETALGVSSVPAIQADVRWYGQDRRWGMWVGASFAPDSTIPERWTAAVGVARRWGK